MSKRWRLPSTATAGFTIVETLIVLAAGGLILLIVLLAIPALQRSSRNNQRKQDVTVVLQAVSRYELNNGGTFPGPCGGTGGQVACNAAPPPPPGQFLQYDTRHLTFYSPSNPGAVVVTPEQAGKSVASPTDTQTLYIYNYQKCNASSATSTGAGYSDVAALYNIETGGSQVLQCQEL